jgi:hypothetical protein
MIQTSNKQQRLIPGTTIIGLALIVGSLVLPRAAVGDSSNADDHKVSPANYTAIISETYDFKFGPNPFAPSNASSVTGTFIVPEKFVPSLHARLQRLRARQIRRLSNRVDGHG